MSFSYLLLNPLLFHLQQRSTHFFYKVSRGAYVWLYRPNCLWYKYSTPLLEHKKQSLTNKQHGYISVNIYNPPPKKTGGEHDLARKLQFAISYSVPWRLVAHPALLALWMNVLSQSIREGLWNLRGKRQQKYRLWHHLYFQHVILTLRDKVFMWLFWDITQSWSKNLIFVSKKMF